MGCKSESNAQELQFAESNFHVAWHGHATWKLDSAIFKYICMLQFLDIHTW